MWAHFKCGYYRPSHTEIITSAHPSWQVVFKTVIDKLKLDVLSLSRAWQCYFQS